MVKAGVWGSDSAIDGSDRVLDFNFNLFPPAIMTRLSMTGKLFLNSEHF